MPGIIDSAPSCIAHVKGALPADDSADFILQKAYEKCAGIMTFGPGSTYGKDGTGATTSYMVLTWIGIIVMIVGDRRLGGVRERAPARATPNAFARPACTSRRQRRREEPWQRKADASGRSSSRRCRRTTRRFERVMIILSIICIIVVLFIILGTNLGTEFRPKA